MSLTEAAKVWGVSRRTAYRMAELRIVEVVRFGRRIVVSDDEVERVRRAGSGGPIARAGIDCPARPKIGRPAAVPKAIPL